MRAMQTMERIAVAVVIATLGLGGVALAQPADPDGDAPADPWAGDHPDQPEDTDQPPVAQPVPNDPGPRAEPEPLISTGGFQKPVRKRRKALDHPSIFSVDTGYMLPAGVILGKFGLDTGGGVATDTRIGLGDVAEFGFETTDRIGTVDCQGQSCGEFDAVQPYALAQFRMGLGEHRIFAHQPALTLGFRKSFTRKHDSRKTRVAELYLSASKKLGDSTKIHVGGVFWDAGIKRNGSDSELLLHDSGWKNQLRAFGGLEFKAKRRSTLLLELGWAPVFQLREATGENDSIHLKPSLSWGVRFEFSKWGVIESGVRVPDIQEINLLDAQIFGQLKFVSRRFQSFLEGLR